MKKILILGASLLQLPAIRKAKELGYTVGVVDYDPKAPGIIYADAYFNVSTNDVDRVVEVATSFGADGVMTLATDMPVRSVAAACEALGLPGLSFETAIKATDKGEMIKAFKEHSIAHPWFYICEKFEEVESLDIEYPCIIKPTDSSGSRGVVFVNSKGELGNAFIYSKKQSRSGKVIIEEFLQGDEVSVEIIISSGIPHVLAVTDKITTGPPHFVEIGHSQPSRLPDDAVCMIKELAIEAVKAVGINDGAAHVEIMLTKNGPVMIELGARLGGDFIATHLVPLSTGIDMVSAAIHKACGENVDLNPRLSKGSCVRYFDADYGTIERIDGIKDAMEIPGVKEIILMKKKGDISSRIASSNDRVGVVIAQGDDALEAERACCKALEFIRISVV